MADGFRLMWVFNIQIEVTRNHVINADFPRLLILDAAGKTIGLVTPPVDLRLKLLKLHRLGFAVVFHARRIRMLIEPNLFGWLTFGKEQQVGFNAGIGVKHTIR